MAKAKARSALRGLSLYYLFIYAATGSVWPQLPVLFSRRGFSASEISWIMALNPVLGTFVPALWGLVADLFHARVLALRLAALGAGLLVLLLVPEHPLSIVIVAMAAFSFFRLPTGSMADAVAHDVLRHVRHQFARIRLYGSVGFASCALISGWLGGASRPALILSIVAAMYFGALVSTSIVQVRPRDTAHAAAKTAYRFFLRGPMALVLLGTTIYYAGHSTFDVYFSLHLNALGHGESYIGLAWAVGVVSEIAVMLAMPVVLRTRPPHTLLAFAGIVSIVRWTLLASVVSKGAILAIQPLHGITYGVWYLALSKHLQDQAPPALRATVASSFATSSAIGTAIGYLFGGRLFDLGGGRYVFGFAAISALVATILYGVLPVVERRAERLAAPGS